MYIVVGHLVPYIVIQGALIFPILYGVHFLICVDNAWKCNVVLTSRVSQYREGLAGV